MITPIRREQKVRLGSLELGVSMDARKAEALRNSAAFRYLVRPAIRRLRSAVSSPPKQAAVSHSNGSAPVDGATGPVLSTAYSGVKRVASAPATPEARAIIEKIAGYDWYHTIDLGHGVSTPGYVDHREQLPYYHLPHDMRGMRVLDVATFDGYWAFEFERRGAEVVGIDLSSNWDIDVGRNWRADFEANTPREEKGRGFQIAKEILGSKVQRESCSVYDISPERLGMFDMVFTSDMLIHIRDPLAAMEAVWTVTKGFAVFADVYHPDLDFYGGHALVEFCHKGTSDMWWRPSIACYNHWLRLARFDRIDERARFELQSSYEDAIPKVVFHAYPPAEIARARKAASAGAA